jgi:hypothetical protein
MILECKKCRSNSMSVDMRDQCEGCPDYIEDKPEDYIEGDDVDYICEHDGCDHREGCIKVICHQCGKICKHVWMAED